MSENERLLELIEDAIAAHGGDLGGWTRSEGETLQLFDGRVTLRANVIEPPAGAPPEPPEMVHAHVLTTLHEHDDEVLEACLVGVGNDRDEALKQASVVWMTAVAGPIRSFLDNKPVCMTCQAGVIGGDRAQGYSEGDYGLAGLRAFVGPAIARGLDDDIWQALDENKPWFRYAAESAAPRRVHMVKVTILSDPQHGWQREMEIDGHDVSHRDPNWPVGIKPQQMGYVTRFAVFEFPRNSREIARRAELERTILHFAANYAKHADTDELMAAMEQEGFDPELVHEVESFSTIAFGRALFEPLGAQYVPTVIRARRDGRVETDVQLMTIPAYTRARALTARISDSMPLEEFQALAMYNAESHVLSQVFQENEQPDLTQIQMFPLVVPDRGVSDETMNAAIAQMHQMLEDYRATQKAKKKPWWKFW